MANDRDDEQKGAGKGGPQPKNDDNFAGGQSQGQSGQELAPRDRQDMRDIDQRGNRNQGQEQSVSGQQRDRAKIAEKGQEDRGLGVVRGGDEAPGTQRSPQQGSASPKNKGR